MNLSIEGERVRKVGEGIARTVGGLMMLGSVLQTGPVSAEPTRQPSPKLAAAAVSELQFLREYPFCTQLSDGTSHYKGLAVDVYDPNSGENRLATGYNMFFAKPAECDTSPYQQIPLETLERRDLLLNKAFLQCSPERLESSFIPKAIGWTYVVHDYAAAPGYKWKEVINESPTRPTECDNIPEINLATTIDASKSPKDTFGNRAPGVAEALSCPPVAFPEGYLGNKDYEWWVGDGRNVSIGAFKENGSYGLWMNQLDQQLGWRGDGVYYGGTNVTCSTDLFKYTPFVRLNFQITLANSALPNPNAPTSERRYVADTINSLPQVEARTVLHRSAAQKGIIYGPKDVNVGCPDNTISYELIARDKPEGHGFLDTWNNIKESPETGFYIDPNNKSNGEYKGWRVVRCLETTPTGVIDKLVHKINYTIVLAD